MTTISLLRGSSCPGCGQGDGGIEHQAGLHQDPIIQCLHCLARVFTGVDGFRAVVPEDKAPAVRMDFLMAKPFNAGLDGLNRQIADFQSIADDHARRAAYWTRRVAEAKARRESFMGVPRENRGDSSAVQQAPVQPVRSTEDDSTRGGKA